MVLPLTHQMERLSCANVDLLCAKAGVQAQTQFDDYGVDLVLRDIKVIKNRYVPSGPPIDVQIKSTRTLSGKTYDLDVKNYNYLVSRQVNEPERYLFLVVFDQALEDSVEENKDPLHVWMRGFWWQKTTALSMNKASARIEIDPENRLNSLAIRNMISQASLR